MFSVCTRAWYAALCHTARKRRKWRKWRKVFLLRRISDRKHAFSGPKTFSSTGSEPRNLRMLIDGLDADSERCRNFTRRHVGVFRWIFKFALGTVAILIGDLPGWLFPAAAFPPLIGFAQTLAAGGQGPRHDVFSQFGGLGRLRHEHHPSYMLAPRAAPGLRDRPTPSIGPSIGFWISFRNSGHLTTLSVWQGEVPISYPASFAAGRVPAACPVQSILPST